jgi:hypothetical protein
MSPWTHHDFPAAFSRAQRKIEQWRERHRPRAPLPEELWREAAELAGTHGIHRTAKALRLDYYSLKKRAAAAAGPGEHAPAFVEIRPGEIAAPRPECIIDLEDPSGAKMRIRLQGGQFPDLVALTRLFREGC